MNEDVDRALLVVFMVLMFVLTVILLFAPLFMIR
jgi:hypothetical protein